MKLREEEFYEQYHQHGGTTIIPTEIFNELYDDATEEIERLNKDLKDACEVIERLKEDKKKAIEYIEEKAPQSLCLPNGVYDMRGIDKIELLNILRGEDNENTRL